MEPSPLPILITRGFKYSPQDPVLKFPNKVSQPYSTTRNIIIREDKQRVESKTSFRDYRKHSKECNGHAEDHTG